MGRRSDSESRRRNRHSEKHKRVPKAPEHYAPRRPRITNFDRPPQPTQLEKLIGNYLAQERKGFMINNPEATKRSRRVFIGNIHKNTQEIKIRKFVSKIMVNYGGIIQPGDPIDVSLFLPEQKCMIIELRTVEEAEAALTLDGLVYKDNKLRFKRTADYWSHDLDYHNQVIVPRVNLSKLGLVSPFPDDELNQVFIGGLPENLEETQVLEILQAYGSLKAFRLAKDDDEKLQGYAFFEYHDPSLAERVALSLNGCELCNFQLGGKTLLVRKVISSEYEQELIETSKGIFRGDGPDCSLITQYPGGCIQPNFETIMHKNRPITVAEFVRAKQTIEALEHRAKEIAQQRAERQEFLFASGVGPPGIGYDHRSYEDIPSLCGLPYITGNLFPPLIYQKAPDGTSNIICVTGMIDPNKTVMDNEYIQMYDQIMKKCVEFGIVVALIIPRECEGYSGPCIGKVYIEYIDQSSAVRAKSLIVEDLWFGKQLESSFYDVSKFRRNELD